MLVNYPESAGSLRDEGGEERAPDIHGEGVLHLELRQLRALGRAEGLAGGREGPVRPRGRGHLRERAGDGEAVPTRARVHRALQRVLGGRHAGGALHARGGRAGECV